MSQIFALVVALALALAALPASAAGSDTRESKTVASEWKENVAARRGVVTRSAHDTRHLGTPSASRSSESTTYTSKVHKPKQAFTAIGPNWKAEVPSGAAVKVSVRTSADGKNWTIWRLTEESHGDEVRDRDGRTFGSLVVGELSRYAQYRVTTFPSAHHQWPRVSDVTLTYINATAGPTTQEAQASASGQYQSFGVSKPAVISRAGWGADEKYRFNSSGKEIWDREYLPITKAVLHDTVTRNNDPNPAATVRSIYYYHAVTRGWGDIGYNYLIDEQGRIYEGRYGGQNVVGGHALCYNFGTLGISALGWHGPAYGGTPAGVRPSEAMVSSFKRLIAWHFDRAGIDPLGRGIFMKRNIEPKADLLNILAHHDTSLSSVPCENNHVDPGAYLYNRFGEIRNSVATIMGYQPTPKPVITDVTFAPTTLNYGGRLRVEVTLRNDGTGLMETQAPNPGTVYAENQDWTDKGFPKVTGKYRVLVDQSRNPTGNASPYRWGLGAPLLAHQSQVIVGYITLPRTGPASFWAGMNKENVSTVASRVGTANVSVVTSGATSTTEKVFVTTYAAPPAISPNGDDRGEYTIIHYQLAAAQKVKIELYSVSGQWVKTVKPWGGVDTTLHSAKLIPSNYDAVHSKTFTLPEGQYLARILARSSSGAISEKTVPVGVDLIQPASTSVRRSPAYISPNGDGRNDSTSISASFSEVVRWVVRVRYASGTQLRSYGGSGSTAAARWHGNDSSGRVVPNGIYRYSLEYSDLAGNPGPTRAGNINVDTIRPAVSSLTATSAAPYTLSFNLSERSVVSTVITNAAGVHVAALGPVTKSPGARSLAWNGTSSDGRKVAAGTYTWSLFASDRAANRAISYPVNKTFQVR